MASNQHQRRTLDLAAAGVFAAHTDTILGLVREALADVEPGQSGLDLCVRDFRLVHAIARRLDEAVSVPEPIETWDILGWTLVAGLALAIHRASRDAANPKAKAVRLAHKALATATERHRASSAGLLINVLKDAP